MASPKEAVREVIRSLLEDRKNLEDDMREIDITIRRLRKAFPDAIEHAELPTGDRVGDTPEERPHRSDKPYAGMSNPDAARAYLEAVSGPKKTSEIRKALRRGGVESEAKNFHSTVYTALKRLADDGKIRHLGNGRWAAKEEGGENQDNGSQPREILF